MFCKNCGKELADNAKFCTACGAKTNSSQNVSEKTKKKQDNVVQPVQVQKKKKKKNNGSKIIMIFLISILIILLLTIGCLSYYYFACVRNGKTIELPAFLDFLNTSSIEQLDEDDEEDIENETDSSDEDDEDSTEEGTTSEDTIEPATEASDNATISSTNEVIDNVIIDAVPKAKYSYSFDDSLDGAKAVVRNGDSDGINSGTFPSTVDDSRAIYQSGIEGKSVYLDGTYGIQLADLQNVGETYTICFWMKAENFCDWSPFIQIGSDFLDTKGLRNYITVNQKTDGQPVSPIFNSVQNQYGNSFEIRPDNSSIKSLNTDMWYYITLVVDGSKKGTMSHTVKGKMYLGGQLIGSGNVATGTLNNDSLTAYLGINCWDKLYSVYFDEVRIWDQVLSEDQIYTLYQAYMQ